MTVCTGTKVTEILWEDGRVVGVWFEEGKAGSRSAGTARAPLVVGAEWDCRSLCVLSVPPRTRSVRPSISSFYTYPSMSSLCDPCLRAIEEPELGTLMVTPCEDGSSTSSKPDRTATMCSGATTSAVLGAVPLQYP